MATETQQNKKGEEMEVTLLTEKDIGGGEFKFQGLVVETGLHIGAPDDGMKIGGIDLPVVKRTIWAYLYDDKDDNDKNNKGNKGENDKKKGENDKKKVERNGELVLTFSLDEQKYYRKVTEPYIPGSSLKGKIRSLLEHFFGIVHAQMVVYQEKHKELKNDTFTKNCKLGMPVDSGWLYAFIKYGKNNIGNEVKLLTKLIIHAFGDSGSLKTKKNDAIKELLEKCKKEASLNESEKEFCSKISHLYKNKEKIEISEIIGECLKNKKEGKEQDEICKYLFSNYPEISRFIFRDCYISKDVRRMALEGQIELFEQKTENSIDRIKGTVNTALGGLRTSERVASGVRFDFQVGIRAFDKTEKELFSKLMELGLALLQLDGLGGSTSRGYGQVSFIVEEKEEKEGKEEWKLKKWGVDGEKIQKLRKEIIEQAKKWAKK
jgi:CRISPR-associated protein Csm3